MGDIYYHYAKATGFVYDDTDSVPTVTAKLNQLLVGQTASSVSIDGGTGQLSFHLDGADHTMNNGDNVWVSPDSEGSLEFSGLPAYRQVILASGATGTVTSTSEVTTTSTVTLD